MIEIPIPGSMSGLSLEQMIILELADALELAQRLLQQDTLRRLVEIRASGKSREIIESMEHLQREVDASMKLSLERGEGDGR